MIYIIIVLFFITIRTIEEMLISKIIHYGDSLVFTFIMFSAEFLGGLAVILYQKCYFLNKNKDEQSDKLIKVLKLKSNVQMNMSDKLYKIIILIFFTSFFDFTEFIILYYLPQIAIISPTSDQRLCIVITITSSLLCTYALRLKTGKHHNFSLIGMSICLIFTFILDLIYKSKGVNFGNFI